MMTIYTRKKKPLIYVMNLPFLYIFGYNNKWQSVCKLLHQTIQPLFHHLLLHRSFTYFDEINRVILVGNYHVVYPKVHKRSIGMIFQFIHEWKEISIVATSTLVHDLPWPLRELVFFKKGFIYISPWNEYAGILAAIVSPIERNIWGGHGRAMENTWFTNRLWSLEYETSSGRIDSIVPTFWKDK